MTETSLDEALQSLRTAVAEEDMGAVVGQTRALFRREDLNDEASRLRAFTALATVADFLGDPTLPGPLAELTRSSLWQRIRRARPRVEAWFAVGQACHDVGLPDAALVALRAAYDRAPEVPAVVSGLVQALGDCDRHAEALAVLDACPIEGDAFLNFLHAFHALHAGRIEAARALAARLDHDGDLRELSGRIVRSLARVDAVQSLPGALDSYDLRGWHFVHSGGVLLHLSPHGEEEMRGRYAFFQQNPSTLRMGIERMARALRGLGLAPSRILHTASEPSQTLALALGRRLRVPVEPIAGAQDGLLVTYDTSDLADGSMDLLLSRGAIRWWNHSQDWTGDQGTAPDFVTLLVQRDTPPWAEQMTVDPDTGKVVMAAPPVRSPAEWAEAILTAEIDESVHPRDDDAGFDAFVGAARRALPARGEGTRQADYFWPGAGTVPSGRFD